MKIQKLTQFAATAAVFCAATSYAVSNDALLDLLVEKGVLTDTEATSVAAELKNEAPVFVGVKGKAVSDIKLTGRLHFQYDSMGDDAGSDDRDRFSFRRVYLGAEAKFSEGWYGKIIGNFGGKDDSIAIDKAVMGWKYDPKAEFEFGYTKVPFGFYETTSSSKIKTVERSIANRVFVENDGFRLGGRHTGVFSKGKLGGGFSYKAALVTSSPSNDRDDKSNGEKDGLGAFGRLQWKSEKTDNGQLLIGADLAFMENGSNYADKGSDYSGDGDTLAYGLHANYSIGDFNVSAETLFGKIENQKITGGDIDVFGFTVTPSYMINENWEVVAAYSMVDSDGGNLLDADDLVRRSGSGKGYDEGDSVYLGFNYYIIGNDLKLSGGYEIANFEADGKEDMEVDGFRFRLQALF